MWTFFKKGLGATNFFEVGAFIRTRPELKVPNVQFEFIPMLGEFQHGSVKLENGFQYFFSLMRPTSTGRVWLGSKDPLAAPNVLLQLPVDQRRPGRRDCCRASDPQRRFAGGLGSLPW
ncbi:glucose-methanol-choline oxidoreductase [Pseudomonas putida S11]|nr:glucose-methanol-choline oxidoreductase [Pseudomonas putida S11]